MDKIFIVTSGEYSGYGIEAVFSTEELAKKFIGSFSNTYSNMEIEEWKLDPFSNEIKQGRKPFFLRIDKEGKTSDIEIRDSAYGFEAKTEIEPDPFYDVYGNLVSFSQKTKTMR